MFRFDLLIWLVWFLICPSDMSWFLITSDISMISIQVKLIILFFVTTLPLVFVPSWASEVHRTQDQQLEPDPTRTRLHVVVVALERSMNTNNLSTIGTHHGTSWLREQMDNHYHIFPWLAKELARRTLHLWAILVVTWAMEKFVPPIFAKRVAVVI